MNNVTCSSKVSPVLGRTEEDQSIVFKALNGRTYQIKSTQEDSNFNYLKAVLTPLIELHGERGRSVKEINAFEADMIDLFKKYGQGCSIRCSSTQTSPFPIEKRNSTGHVQNHPSEQADCESKSYKYIDDFFQKIGGRDLFTIQNEMSLERLPIRMQLAKLTPDEIKSLDMHILAARYIRYLTMGEDERLRMSKDPSMAAEYKDLKRAFHVYGNLTERQSKEEAILEMKDQAEVEENRHVTFNESPEVLRRGPLYSSEIDYKSILNLKDKLNCVKEIKEFISSCNFLNPSQKEVVLKDVRELENHLLYYKEGLERARSPLKLKCVEITENTTLEDLKLSSDLDEADTSQLDAGLLREFNDDLSEISVKSEAFSDLSEMSYIG